MPYFSKMFPETLAETFESAILGLEVVGSVHSQEADAVRQCDRDDEYQHQDRPEINWRRP